MTVSPATAMASEINDHIIDLYVRHPRAVVDVALAMATLLTTIRAITDDAETRDVAVHELARAVAGATELAPGDVTTFTKLSVELAMHLELLGEKYKASHGQH